MYKTPVVLTAHLQLAFSLCVLATFGSTKEQRLFFFYFSSAFLPNLDFETSEGKEKAWVMLRSMQLVKDTITKKKLLGNFF